MPLYLIERNFAEERRLTKEGVERIQAITEELGMRWLYSFLSADKKKTYCLYEAESVAALVEEARQAGIPADVIIEVDQIRPDTLA